MTVDLSLIVIYARASVFQYYLSVRFHISASLYLRRSCNQLSSETVAFHTSLSYLGNAIFSFFIAIVRNEIWECINDIDSNVENKQ